MDNIGLRLLQVATKSRLLKDRQYIGRVSELTARHRQGVMVESELVVLENEVSLRIQKRENNSNDKLLLSDVVNSNDFGKLVKNKSTTKNCCEQCKYSEYNGENDACNTCAFDSSIPLNHYYL